MAEEGTQASNQLGSGSNNPTSAPCCKRRAVEDQLKAQELEILSTENALKALQEKRYELYEQLNSTTTIMTSLPLDVLSEIFSLVCTAPDSLQRDWFHLPVQFTLGRVCRAWRRIAWSTPRLWTTISLKFVKGRYETQEFLLRAWIARTAKCPLDLCFAVTHYSPKWEPPLELFHFLLGVSRRWRSFSYRFRSNNFPIALTDEDAQFPLLTSLTVVGNMKNSWKLNQPPRLQSLTVHGQHFSHLDINWNFLTRLSATSDLAGCLTVLDLASASSVDNLELNVTSRHLPLSASDPPYILPNLTCLSMEGANATIGSLFYHFKLPLLKELKINLQRSPSQYDSLESLAELARRSGFQLMSLVIKQECIREEIVLLNFLQKMPSIESLELEFRSFPAFKLTNRTLDRLNPRQPSTDANSKDFLPNLNTLKFAGCVDFSPDSLVDMVRARFEAFQKRLQPSDHDRLPFDKKLSMEINYSNIRWHREQNPNIWKDFYSTIATMSSEGLTFAFEWFDPPDSDDISTLDLSSDED